MRGLPFKATALWRAVREIRAAAADFRPLVVAGAAGPAADLATALGEGATPGALRGAGRAPGRRDLDGAGLLVFAIEGDRAGAADEEALRLAARLDVPVVCLLVAESRGLASARVPEVEPEDVVVAPAGEPLPVARVVERVVARADERASVLASRLPAVRRAAARALVERFARQNAVLGAAIFVPGADLPALTLNQIRMVLHLATAYGEEIDRARARELLAVVGAGFGFRQVARQVLGFVPLAGWAVKGGVAYAGTRALGEAAIRYFEVGGARKGFRSVRSGS